MPLTPMQEQLLTALEAMPSRDLSTDNRVMLRKLQGIKLDSQRAGLPGSISAMIDLGGQEARVPILPADRARLDRSRATPGQLCPNCGESVTPKSLVSGRVYACPCGRRWQGPRTTHIASISPSDPRNQPKTRQPRPPEGKPMLLTSSQIWRKKSKDK